MDYEVSPCASAVISGGAGRAWLGGKAAQRSAQAMAAPARGLQDGAMAPSLCLAGSVRWSYIYKASHGRARGSHAAAAAARQCCSWLGPAASRRQTLRMICAYLEVFTTIFDMHLWNISGHANVVSRRQRWRRRQVPAGCDQIELRDGAGVRSCARLCM